ncbi:glutamate racemase [Thalassotalea mangrovi]|uniref:Glutamate racemase n=1 Tax=Thalassotalea mangrovi TaxID=2572245 RepID=A0A4U1B5P2_9GAMM|nr:glutamate racemase [Thalassotalea mangrovi]TKB45630.1 glutamate racemase [Thalassotalea mangrovi]
MNKHAPIGVFDSGIGGLSICRAIRHVMPTEDMLYFADTEHSPYGTKSDDFLRYRTQQILTFFQEKGCKAIVVACNTATVHTIENLRSNQLMPVIGVEPGIKPARQATVTGKIGVLATNQTIASESFARLKHRICADIEVYSQPCPDFVRIVEQGAIDSPQTEAAVRHYVQPLLDKNCDQLVLGCTHFSFLRDSISRFVQGRAEIIDTADAVARQVERRLGEAQLLNHSQRNASLHFFSSGCPDQASSALQNCWTVNLQSTRRVCI